MIKRIIPILSAVFILIASFCSFAENINQGRLVKLKELHEASLKIAAEHNTQKAQFENELQKELNALGSTFADRERRRQLIKEAVAQREKIQAAYRERMDAIKQKEDIIRNPKGQAKAAAKENLQAETKSIRELAEKKRQQDLLLQAERSAREQKKPITVFEGSEPEGSSQLKLPPPPSKKYGIKGIKEQSKNNDY